MSDENGRTRKGDGNDVISPEDDTYYREHYESQPDKMADRAYNDVRGAYYLGQIASHNPNFLAREWDEVAPELEAGWVTAGEGFASWTVVQPYARVGFHRGRSHLDDQARRAKSLGEETERRE